MIIYKYVMGHAPWDIVRLISLLNIIGEGPTLIGFQALSLYDLFSVLLIFGYGNRCETVNEV